MMTKNACVLILAVLPLAGCGPAKTEPPTPAPEVEKAETFGIKNGLTPLPGLLTAGQPTVEQLELAAKAGYRTVINLRAAGEEGQIPNAEAVVTGLGMRYVHIPIAGAEDLNESNAQLLADAMAEPPTLLHCASSNRVGALLAIKAVQLDGMTVDEAMDLGRRGGMTRMGEAVQKILEGGTTQGQ